VDVDNDILRVHCDNARHPGHACAQVAHLDLHRPHQESVPHLTGDPHCTAFLSHHSGRVVLLPLPVELQVH